MVGRDCASCAVGGICDSLSVVEALTKLCGGLFKVFQDVRSKRLTRNF